VARFGQRSPRLIAEGQELSALTPLPIEALRIEPDATMSLRAVGIDTVGHLLAQPRSSLAARFGAELLLRLDRATGAAVETLDPVRPVPPLSVERVFDGPTSNAEGLQIATRELVGALAAELHTRESGVLRAELRLARSDLPPEAITLTLSRPSRDARHLWALLRPKLELAHLGYGVERLTLTAMRTGRLRHEQNPAWEKDARDSDQATALGEFLDQLLNRLGEQRVRRIRPRASHLPEKQFTHPPWNNAGTEPENTTNPAPPRADHPSTLLEKPEPVAVIALTPDGPVSRVTWRGQIHDVATCRGPQRINLEWWPPEAQPRSVVRGRDYFKIGTKDGQWLWLYRRIDTGEWFVHGLWT
jgi:protein ImuB